MYRPLINWIADLPMDSGDEVTGMTVYQNKIIICTKLGKFYELDEGIVSDPSRPK